MEKVRQRLLERLPNGEKKNYAPTFKLQQLHDYKLQILLFLSSIVLTIPFNLFRPDNFSNSIKDWLFTTFGNTSYFNDELNADN